MKLKLALIATALAGSTTESLRNIELVKSLGLGQQEIRRLNSTTGKILKLELKKVKYLRSLSFIQGSGGDRSYTIENIDPSLLKTSDGEDVSLEATYDALTGLLTIVGKDEGGDPVFTLTMQTNGSGTGEFEFDLHQPLNHPWHDLDSKNDGPLTSYEDNLKFDVTVEGKDSDGDTAEGHIKIKVDDDSPKATCDVDCHWHRRYSSQSHADWFRS